MNALLLALPLLAAAPVPKDAAPDKGKLDGTWKVVKFEKNGKQEARDETWTIEGTKLTIPMENDRWNVTLKLDPKASPMELDYTFKNVGIMQLGVYELEGDTLVIATTGLFPSDDVGEMKRPKSIKEGYLRFTLKRVKK